VGEHETVAALAAQIDEVRQVVDSLNMTVTRWNARLEQEGIGATLIMRLEYKQLKEKVAELAAALADALETHQLRHPAPTWHDLERDEEASRLAELQEWVDGFLRVQYPGYRLPDCWPDHREARWELGNLYTEWLRIYHDSKTADLGAALLFHERWFPGVLARLNRSIACDEAGCQLRTRTQ
jgi:hypothetical protein